MSTLRIYDEKGSLASERELDRERFTIGRLPENDIVLSHGTVSGEHAAITCVRNDCFIEDLDSTNGTRVNGRLVKKYLLQDGDEVKVGKFRLRYSQKAGSEGAVTTVRPEVTRAGPEAFTEEAANAQFISTVRFAAGLGPDTGTQLPRASLQILSGPSAGRELELVRSTTTLGKPGMQVAVVARRHDGFYFMFEEGASYPLVNGAPIGASALKLNNYDVIELAGIMMEFSLKD